MFQKKLRLLFSAEASNLKVAKTSEVRGFAGNMKSSQIDQKEKFADNKKSKMSAHHETSSLKNTESPACQSSSVLSVGPEVGSEPCDEGDHHNSLTASGMQAIFQREADDIQGLEDESSDSALLLEGHGSRSNGEGSFENENFFQPEDTLQSSHVQAELRSPEDCGNKEESHSLNLDSDERDLQNEDENRTSDVRPQPEIMLQPLSLRAESSRTLSSSREELGTNPSWSVRFIKPTGTRPHSSPAAEYGKYEEDGADFTSSIHFIKSTGTRQHPNPTAEHGREELGANSPSTDHYIKPSSTREHASPSAEHSREELGANYPSTDHYIKPTSTREHSSLSAEYGREELGANSPSTDHYIKPTSTREHSSQSAKHSREELGADPPWSVRFIKPTGIQQHPSPTSECGSENRDIFETGGEQSKSGPPAGVSCAGGDEEIEHLPGESPEPQIVISPSVSDEPRMNWRKMAKAFMCRGCLFLSGRICRQFLKAPLFYFISTLAIMAGINSWDRGWLERDISIAIIFSFVTFILITLVFDRGQFSHMIGGGRNSCIGECRRGCRKADSCIPWCCCRSPSPLLERHSQYRHLEEEGAFEHEIADVSNLGPRDCPQMKLVEQREFAHSESPDYLPEVSQVDADVHVGKRDGEKLGAARKHLAKAAAHPATTKPHKTRSERSHPKTFRADIHAADHVMSDPPELSPIRETALEDETQNGHGQPEKNDEAGTRHKGAALMSKELEYTSSGEDLSGSERSRMTTNSPRCPGGGVFKKFSDCSPTLSRFANVRQSDTPSRCFRAGVDRSTSPEDELFYVDVTGVPDAEEFMCEHYGQSVACSCPTLLAKENIER